VKPNPKILLYTISQIKKAKKLGKIEKARVFFVGDNVSDVITAKNAGVKSIAVLSGNSTKEELQNANPDFIIPTLEKIFSIPELSQNN
jgi:phosphoglycolate phosphatase